MPAPRSCTPAGSGWRGRRRRAKTARGSRCSEARSGEPSHGRKELVVRDGLEGHGVSHCLSIAMVFRPLRMVGKALRRVSTCFSRSDHKTRTRVHPRLGGARFVCACGRAKRRRPKTRQAKSLVRCEEIQLLRPAAPRRAGAVREAPSKSQCAPNRLPPARRRSGVRTVRSDDADPGWGAVRPAWRARRC